MCFAKQPSADDRGSRQRAFRERKERYIQELEEKTMAMNKRIASLESDRKRLEGALRVARAEVDAFKSMPSHLTPQSSGVSDRSQIACKIDGLDGKKSVVFTLEIGVQGIKVCPQHDSEEVSSSERSASIRPDTDDLVAEA